MPRTWKNENSSQATANQVFADNAEHVIATLPVICTQTPDAVVIVRAFCQILTAAGDTTLTLRLRRGVDTTGTLIGEANAENLEAAAGGTESHSIVASDSPGEVAGQAYVLTGQVDNAAGFTADYTFVSATY